MSSTPFKSGLAAAAAAALLCLPVAGAHASTDPFAAGGTTGASALAMFSSAASTSTVTATALPVTTSSQTQTQVASDFLTQTLTQSTSTTTTSTASPFADGIQVSVYVQSAPALRNPLSVNLRGNSDLALWNLVASIRAQQGGNSFDLVDTGITSLQVSTAGGAVSAVPLPGAAWLLVMGVLGLTGTRLTGLTPVASDKKKGAPRYPSLGSFGAAMPA
ncbi:MAG: hypothetical protein QFE16_14030 [Pseudomonadota bacterium]|nr:hypothetical protein [Pseudomonadota bacterium]